MNQHLPKKIKEKLESVPRKPGVYLFRNKKGNVIYVGKAKILRNRVRSYFQNSRAFDAKLLRILSLIDDFETIITDTEVEALILEANLIKEYKPRYNINLKDDKSYPYIRITNEEFPRIFPTRRLVRDGSRYFGPYTDVQGMRNLLKTVKRLFPVRKCNYPMSEKIIEQGKIKLCLNYHIKQCDGPCEKYVSRQEYAETIENIVDFLKGNTDAVEEKLCQHMQALASQKRFELAARIRDQLENIQMFASRQKVFDPALADRDIVATALHDEEACSVVFRVRQGKIIAKNHFYLQNITGEDFSSISKAFVKQYYLKTDDIPSEIVVPVPFEDEAEAVSTWLSERAGRRVKLTYPQRGRKANLLKMCTRNAKYQLQAWQLQKQQAREYTAGAVQALQNDLHLNVPPKRIEGFDISNIQGKNPVASMVCFINGKPVKSEYRRFKIRTKETPDDFAMMNEVVKRRYTRVLREKKELPDLVLIDGGKGQLGAAMKALNKVGLENQAIIALAKRLDEVFVPGLVAPQNIPKNSAGLKLLQRVRDESHRFAISYHRNLRNKQSVTSELDDIAGVGKARKNKLLQAFGSLNAVKKANVKQLSSVEGISESLASQIYEHFNQRS